MKKIIPVLIVSFILLQIQCRPQFENLINKTRLSPFETGLSVSIINYDAVYFLIDHYLHKNSWPATGAELSAYTAGKNHSIDLSMYKYFRIEQSSPERINIHFIIAEIKNCRMSMTDVKGITGIYITDKDKVNIYSHKDQKINSSFIVGEYPYNDKNFLTADGYSIYHYIQYSTKGTSFNSNYQTMVQNLSVLKMKELHSKCK